jgi:hypothetical protein
METPRAAVNSIAAMVIALKLALLVPLAVGIAIDLIDKCSQSAR